MGSGSEELIENVCSCDDSSEEVGGKVIGRKMCRGDVESNLFGCGEILPTFKQYLTVELMFVLSCTSHLISNLIFMLCVCMLHWWQVSEFYIQWLRVPAPFSCTLSLKIQNTKT